MKLGVGLPVSGSWATPDRILPIAVRAEELGYDSLWTFQRLLAPEGLADQYRSVLDPLLPLAFVAAQTWRIRLGVAVVNLPFLSPVILAKQLATLDVLSGGRVDAGIGTGWQPEEFTATGASLGERGARVAEYVSVLRTLWTEKWPEHSGRFYEVPRAEFEPKPVQARVPVLLGGTAPAALRRAGRIADGWISSSSATQQDVAPMIRLIRQGAEEVGRDPETMRFICRCAVRVREPGRADRRPLTGSFAEIRGDVERLAEQGMTELFLDLNFDPRIGSPDADPQVSMRVAEELLDAFSPLRD
ncbi:MAG: LLM class flavin-dependent oxidoreductase [Hamadaea sp.]|uniref:LLM class flavin-dependent oxidoreductase n=1 Tax=Hamadaea sp. TaxID=2024425 RepID=UPI0017B731AE|nr:TIGR03619 family F420-dependent LLM class oxidoreductase [Hamadaea sp.]NUR70007.1 LLM class flavin-dependent oxidoreductase [Hamadaea sp.]NUT19715.1 LLM class flavin-dependent oxidoreductase [Hamadaea sp.]